MLIRNPETLEAIRQARGADASKVLRSYYMPQYILDVLELLAEENGLARSHVLRAIVDEWIEMVVQPSV